MSWWRRPERPAPDWALACLDLDPRDRVLAWGQDTVTGALVVATLHALHHVPPAAQGTADAGAGRDALAVLPTGVAADAAARWSRPWLDVLAGAWDPGTHTLSVTWADGSRASMWTLQDRQLRLPSVFQERVRASLYVSAPIESGGRAAGQVALRRDLASGELREQVSWRGGRRAHDPAAAAEVQRLIADLRDQAGL